MPLQKLVDLNIKVESIKKYKIKSYLKVTYIMKRLKEYLQNGIKSYLSYCLKRSILRLLVVSKNLCRY